MRTLRIDKEFARITSALEKISKVAVRARGESKDPKILDINDGEYPKTYDLCENNEKYKEQTA